MLQWWANHEARFPALVAMALTSSQFNHANELTVCAQKHLSKCVPAADNTVEYEHKIPPHPTVFSLSNQCETCARVEDIRVVLNTLNTLTPPYLCYCTSSHFV